MSAESQWIIETTTETFEKDVVERSLETTVVVDFWAPWCEPCRQLAPTLEKLADEYNGRFVLVKVNIDEAAEVAGMCGVQQIPHVLAFRDGQPVHQFAGLMPEDELRQWLDSVVPSPAEGLIMEGQQLEESEGAAAAEAKFREALALVPDNSTIQIHLARVLLAQGKEDEPQQIISELEKRGFLEPEAEKIKSQLDIIHTAEDSGGLDEARKAAEAAPDDLTLQLHLADALAVDRKFEEAFEICLDVIAKDKAGIGGEAKETMVKIFDMPTVPGEMVSAYRRRLATAMY